MNIYSFDIDGTICSNTYGKYDKAQPFLDRIESINTLIEKEILIKLFTARGSTTELIGRSSQKNNSEWGLLYHELILGKPEQIFY